MTELPSTSFDAADPHQLLARARVALRTGAVAAALADLEAAHALASARLDGPLAAEVLVEMARVLRAQGAPEQALLCVERAAEEARAAFAAAIQGEARLLEAELLRA